MDMKTCTTCQEEKPREEFSSHPSNRDRLQASCKPCCNAKARVYYLAQRAEKISLARKRKIEMREWLREQKTGPCADCGVTYDPVCMDFDHLPEFTKEDNIANLMRRNASKARLAAEIAKCELVCSNCHRLRTRDRLEVF